MRFKDTGVISDHKLLWNEHINNVTKILARISEPRPFLQQHSFLSSATIAK
jgi:hypothetical protein